MGGVDVPSSSCLYDPLIVIESGELLVSSRDGLYAYTIDPDEDLSDKGDFEGFDKAYYLEPNAWFNHSEYVLAMSRYLSDRLSLLQAGGEWMGKTVDDLRTYFTAQGTTALEDYLTNGDALGLTPPRALSGTDLHRIRLSKEWKDDRNSKTDYRDHTIDCTHDGPCRYKRGHDQRDERLSD